MGDIYNNCIHCDANYWTDFRALPETALLEGEREKNTSGED
jgi:hypothetical protein